MNYLVTLVVTVAAAELVYKLPFFSVAHTSLLNTKKALAVITSRHISDCWKERVVLHYSLNIIRSSLAFAFFLLLLMALIISPVYLVEKLWGFQIMSFVTSLHGALFMLVVSIFYLFLRVRFVRQ